MKLVSTSSKLDGTEWLRAHRGKDDETFARLELELLILVDGYRYTGFDAGDDGQGTAISIMVKKFGLAWDSSRSRSRSASRRAARS